MGTVSEEGTFQTILKCGGVPPDAVLIVHSAIARLSRQGFRAERIIEALLGHLSTGTLLMPTMTWRTVTPEYPVFDEQATPSHTGVLTEVFRTRYATARSLHPTHSVAGSGPAATLLLSSHHIGDTPAPATSPYGLMRDYPAYILMIGVGLECCTAIHHPEEIVAPDFYVKPKSSSESYTLRSRTGQTFTYMLRRHPRLDRDFPKFVPRLAAMNHILLGNINGVPWMLFKASDLLRLVFSALINTPYGTLAEPYPDIPA